MPHGLERKLTYSDLPEEPNDGNRYEIIAGRLFVNPSPNTIHQTVSIRLAFRLFDYFEARGHRVFQAPTDVILTAHDVFVPDIVVANVVGDITIRGIERPPLIVIEVLSPSTRRMDLGAKKDRYAELGIRHYWIVDPIDESFACFQLEADIYKLRVAPMSEGVLIHPDFDGLAIDVQALWAALPGRDR